MMLCVAFYNNRSICFNNLSMCLLISDGIFQVLSNARRDNAAVLLPATGRQRQYWGQPLVEKSLLCSP